MDPQGQLEKALGFYRKALEHDPGSTITHSWYGMKLNRRWVEEKLVRPFVRER